MLSLSPKLNSTVPVRKMFILAQISYSVYSIPWGLFYYAVHIPTYTSHVQSRFKECTICAHTVSGIISFTADNILVAIDH